MKEEALWIWGSHSVEACLATRPELVLELGYAEDADPELVKKIQSLAQSSGVKFHRWPRLARTLEDKRTQGIAARIKDEIVQSYFSERSALGALWRKDIGAQWAILDGVQDPRNFGAILRSAAAFGVHGIFVGERKQAPVSGVVAQASAGCAFRIPIYACRNVKDVMRDFLQLRDEEALPGLVLALDAEGKDLREILAQTSKASPQLMWVLGAEGAGLRPSLQSVATLARIPMSEGVESLNVSVAAALAFYEGSLAR